MLHIEVKGNDDGSVVRLSGQLAGELVAEAKRACFSAVAPLLIDATELQDADADGLALLAQLIERGARVENLSKYLVMRVNALRERGEQ